MLKLIRGIIHSTAFRILVRFIASLASAIVVVSGFLYVLNLGQKTKEEDGDEQDVAIPDETSEDDPSQ